MPQRQELVDRVSSLGPDVVPVVVEDDAPPAMGSLTAGRIEGVRLDRCDAAVTQPAGSEGSAAGDQALEEFTTSTFHGSILGTTVLNRSYQPHESGRSVGQQDPADGSAFDDKSELVSARPACSPPLHVL